MQADMACEELCEGEPSFVLVWAPPQQQELLPLFLKPMLEWSREEFDFFADHTFELVKECCVQCEKLVGCFAKKMALRKMQLLAVMVRAFSLSMSNDPPMDLGPEWVRSSPCDGLCSLLDRLYYAGYTARRLAALRKDLGSAVATLRKYQVLFGVDGLLSDIHVACYSILDDIRLGIIGLENDPDSPYYSQEV